MTSSDHWLLAQLTLYTPGFWVLLSIAITLVVSLLWGIFAPGVRDAIIITRFFMVPYCGLLLGGLSPRFMGLNGLDWLVSFSLGVGLLLIILLALVFVRITVALASPLNSGVIQPPRQREEPAWQAIGNQQPRLFPTVIYRIYRSGAEEFHWSFLRGAIWELLLAMPVPPTLPGYWAIWGGALLALPDIFLTNRTLLPRLLKMVVLITTSILFLYTRNFWLCWLLHVAGWTILVSGFGADAGNTAAIAPRAQRRM